jgi:hypothetical protein
MSGGKTGYREGQDAYKSGISGGGTVDSIVAGTNIAVDASDPANPIVSASGGGTVDSIVAGTNIAVDASDPANPIVSAINNFDAIEIAKGFFTVDNINFYPGDPFAAIPIEANDFLLVAVQPLLGGGLGYNHYLVNDAASNAVNQPISRSGTGFDTNGQTGTTVAQELVLRENGANQIGQTYHWYVFKIKNETTGGGGGSLISNNSTMDITSMTGTAAFSGAGEIFHTRFVAKNAQPVNAMEIYLQSVAGGSSLQLGIYDQVFNKIGESAIYTPVNGFNRLAISETILIPGARYYASAFGNNNMQVGYKASAVMAGNGYRESGSSLPAAVNTTNQANIFIWLELLTV